MATKAICMVNVIRLQKPLPKATLTATGDAPLIRAASATTTTAMATKIKASGNQRSAQAVKPIAIRTSTPSCSVARAGEAAESAVAMMNPPKAYGSKGRHQAYAQKSGASTARLRCDREQPMPCGARCREHCYGYESFDDARSVGS